MSVDKCICTVWKFIYVFPEYSSEYDFMENVLTYSCFLEFATYASTDEKWKNVILLVT